MKREIIAPNFSRSKIIDGAKRLGDMYETIVGRDYILRNGLHFHDIYEKLLYPKFKIELFEGGELGTDQDGQKILGRYDVAANTAHLDQIISAESGDPRRAFTCWHEVAGHGVLQGKWLREQVATTGMFGTIKVTEIDLSASVERRLEWQANLFASRLAAPDWLVNYAIKKLINPGRKFLFREPCIYWLNIQGLPLRKYIVDAGDLSGWIGSKISGYFGGLSAEAIGYRITEIGWIDDRTRLGLRLQRAA
jgi:hypothetical protein